MAAAPHRAGQQSANNSAGLLQASLCNCVGEGTWKRLVTTVRISLNPPRERSQITPAIHLECGQGQSAVRGF